MIAPFGRVLFRQNGHRANDLGRYVHRHAVNLDVACATQEFDGLNAELGVKTAAQPWSQQPIEREILLCWAQFHTFGLRRHGTSQCTFQRPLVVAAPTDHTFETQVTAMAGEAVDDGCTL